MPTKQETFDTVVAHLRKQGKRSEFPLEGKQRTKRCAYRSEDGLQCAAGCLIPDDKYSSEIEFDSLIDDESGHLTKAGELIESLGYGVSFVAELQSINDYSEPDKWDEKFKKLSEHHNLIYTPPQPAAV